MNKGTMEKIKITTVVLSILVLLVLGLSFYEHYQDLNNELANLFKNENVSLELFLIRKTFNKLLTKNKVRTTINIKRNSNETKLNNYTGEIEDHFLATINNKLLYDIVDDKKTLFELSNESLSKKLNVSLKTN